MDHHHDRKPCSTRRQHHHCVSRDNWAMRSLALMMVPLSTFVKWHEPQERPAVQFIGIWTEAFQNTKLSTLVNNCLPIIKNTALPSGSSTFHWRVILSILSIIHSFVNWQKKFGNHALLQTTWWGTCHIENLANIGYHTFSLAIPSCSQMSPRISKQHIRKLPKHNLRTGFKNSSTALLNTGFNLSIFTTWMKQVLAWDFHDAYRFRLQYW